MYCMNHNIYMFAYGPYHDAATSDATATSDAATSDAATVTCLECFMLIRLIS